MDYYFFQIINELALKRSWLDTIGVFFAAYFEYVLVAFLFFLLLKNFKKNWLVVSAGLIAAVLARFGLVEIIRWFWCRPRPFAADTVNLLLNHTQVGSFPSGHAAFFFALSTVLFIYSKKK